MAAESRTERPQQADGARDGSPDVVLDVPRVAVDEVVLTVDTLHARIALDARLADLVHLHVGADAEVTNVSLELKGVDAEAHLRAHLDNVVTIFDRALRTVDEHPDVLIELAHTVNGTVEAITDELGELAPAAAPARELGGGAADDEGDGDGEQRTEPSAGGEGDGEQGAEPRAGGEGDDDGGSSPQAQGEGGGERSRSRSSRANGNGGGRARATRSRARRGGRR